MKVIQYSRFGYPPDTAEIVDVDPGPVSDHEVLIRVEVTPVKLNDLYHISGKEGFRRPLPAVPGNEGVGRILEVGRAVTWPHVGDRVFLPIRAGGTWREVMRVPAAGLQRAPEGDPVQLALGTLVFAFLGWAFWRWEMHAHRVPDAPAIVPALEPTDRM